MQNKSNLERTIKEKPWAEKRNLFNPNPITKLLVLLFLGFTIMHYLPFYGEWAVVLLFSVFFFLNGFRRTALFAPLVFAALCFIPGYSAQYFMPVPLRILFSFLYIFRLLFLPYLAGSFFMNFGCGRHLKLHGFSPYPPMHFHPYSRDVPFFSCLHGREESH